MSPFLVIDPNSAWAWNRSGWVKNYLDVQDAAIKEFERTIRLSPLIQSISIVYSVLASTLSGKVSYQR
jgi:hypothetical protein